MKCLSDVLNFSKQSFKIHLRNFLLKLDNVCIEQAGGGSIIPPPQQEVVGYNPLLLYLGLIVLIEEEVRGYHLGFPVSMGSHLEN